MLELWRFSSSGYFTSEVQSTCQKIANVAALPVTDGIIHITFMICFHCWWIGVLSLSHEECTVPLLYPYAFPLHKPLCLELLFKKDIWRQKLVLKYEYTNLHGLFMIQRVTIFMWVMAEKDNSFHVRWQPSKKREWKTEVHRFHKQHRKKMHTVG